LWGRSWGFTMFSLRLGEYMAWDMEGGRRGGGRGRGSSLVRAFLGQMSAWGAQMRCGRGGGVRSKHRLLAVGVPLALDAAVRALGTVVRRVAHLI